MKLKTIMLLAVAAGCGLVAMLGVQQSMNGTGQVEAEAKVSVLMAVTDIGVGEVLTPENVVFRDVSVDTAPENAVLTEEEYKNRSALVQLMRNDFVTTAKVSEPGIHGRSVAIPKGMRVVTVPVNDTTSHSGMLAPGDRVDVLVTYQTRTQRGQTTQTKVLLEYVEVFATGNTTASEASKDSEQRIKNVSLLVTPDQTPYVKLAEKKGNLSLSWRRTDDDELVKVGAVDEALMNELQGTLDKENRGYDQPQYEVYADARTEPEEKPGLKNWIDQQQEQADAARAAAEAAKAAEQKQATVVVAAAEPAKAVWKMEIFHGEERQLVELELPDEGIQESPAPANADGDSQTGDVKEDNEDATEPVSTESDDTVGKLQSLWNKLRADFAT